MNTIDLNTSKSYATEANLIKGTSILDQELNLAEKAGQINHNTIRKMVCRNSEGRWTAVYFLCGNATCYAVFIAREGFKVVG